MVKIDVFTGRPAGCNMCVHKRQKGCKAFPGGIPLPFSSGEFLHEQSVEGDNGIVFEPPADVFLIEIEQ